MKKNYTIFLALFCLVSCKTTKPVSTSPVNKVPELPAGSTGKQNEPVNDTLSYAKDIIANKNKYINKELSVLLNNLKIPVKSYTIINSKFNVIDGIALSFDTRNATSRKQASDDDSKKPAYLHIT